MSSKPSSSDHKNPPPNNQSSSSKNEFFSNTNRSPSARNPTEKSDYRYLKDIGFEGSFYKFALSYLIKPGDDEGYEEAKRILKALRDAEQEEWEALQGKK